MADNTRVEKLIPILKRSCTLNSFQMFSQLLTQFVQILPFSFKKSLYVTGLILTVLLLSGILPVQGQDDGKTILVFGDSITAGLGLDTDRAFPTLIQEKVDSLDLNIEVVNAGVSGETSAGGLRRIDWVLQRKVDIFILELGGNDGLRGLDPAVTKSNLQKIIEKVQTLYPDAAIILTGMEAPPNMGERYTTRFREIFQELSDQNDVIFMPFILEGVAGDPELNQEDGIHPTGEGHRIIAENLWELLEPILAEES